MEYTVTYQNSFVVDGSVVADRIQQFATEWQNDPTGLLKIVKEVYLDGVKYGLQLSGNPVKDYKELPKNEPEAQ